MNCGSCKFWIRDPGKEAKEGICRRYPPEVVPVLQPNALTKSFATMIHFIFPKVREDCLCGEYIPTLMV